MHSLRGLAVALLLLLIVAAPAQATPRGDINGVIRNETTGKPQAGAKVTLLHLQQGEAEPQTTSVTSDKQGRYSFEDLETGAGNVYALDVTHQGGLFASGTITMPSRTKERPVVDADVKVWNTTDDPRSVLLRRNDLFLIPKDNEIGVVDSYRVVNTTDLAYIGRGGAGASTTLGFPLPEEARGSGVVIVESPRIDIPDLPQTEFGFGLTVAIPPGQTDLTFSYSVEGSGGSYDLTRTALYPILETTVFAQEPLEVRSNRMSIVSEEPRAIGGEDYIEYKAGDTIDAGDPVQILAVAEAGMSPWLIVGASVLFGLIALALGIGILLRRRRAAKTLAVAPRAKPERASREGLVVEIAELDLRYGNHEIGEEEWRLQRDRLKARVDELSSQPTP